MRAAEWEQKTVYHRTILWFTGTGGSEPGMWDHTVSQKNKFPQVSGPSCCNCLASHSFIFKFLCIGTKGIALQGACRVMCVSSHRFSIQFSSNQLQNLSNLQCSKGLEQMNQNRNVSRVLMEFITISVMLNHEKHIILNFGHN